MGGESVALIHRVVDFAQGHFFGFAFQKCARRADLATWGSVRLPGVRSKAVESRRDLYSPSGPNEKRDSNRPFPMPAPPSHAPQKQIGSFACDECNKSDYFIQFISNPFLSLRGLQDDPKARPCICLPSCSRRTRTITILVLPGRLTVELLMGLPWSSTPLRRNGRGRGPGR